ncbi:MAG: PIG-L family deacetylase [Calditrichae bacterium]|nr:PIG-L family deacetylase [Calditrichia bacterium]NIW80834.1 PIG-L family deacetylase [Calditrichia bacterium]
MKILYIFPHPDDESFGPAPAISKQRCQGHEVYLLTLTKGEATKERFKFGYSLEQMGQIRYEEMQDVAKTLDLTELTVLDLPDSGLKELDPRKIEDVIRQHIKRIQPAVLVTYPVHGISGFHDHLVGHAVVKRVYLELKEHGSDYLKRLAFFTVGQQDIEQHEGLHNLNYSTEEEIDCVLPVEDEDIENFQKALDCYKTYQDKIEESGIREFINKEIRFEIFQENHHPQLSDLFQGL